jgi:replicative superfamily II helicase
VLAELGVRHLLVATPETLKAMWRDKFRFQQLTAVEAVIVKVSLVLIHLLHSELNSS